jgi:parvulin-like peptidyl-prolyl isomerase
MKMRRVFVPVLTLALGACEGTGGPPSPDTVAQATGVTFTAEAAAEILAPQAQLPNQSQVVEALANLWVDYFLLARVAAEDTTLATLNVSSLVEQNANQEMVLRLREQVIQVDTAFSEEELQDVYERTLPGAQVRARHILLRFPENATPAQIDSVRALAESLRGRLEAGEDFATLARQYSQDTGSGANGGDLGSFGRGEMVPPFEEAAFALDVGEISPVVETTFGLHIIRVDERIVPPFEGNRDQFRAQLQNRRVAEAESTYVAGIIEAAGVKVSDDAFETARKLAETPDMELSGRARERPVVSFTGGSYSVGDLQDWLLFRPAAIRSEVQGATDEQLDGFLRNLTRERLLIQAARQEGIQVPAAKEDSLATAIRSGVKGVAQQLGLLTLSPAEGQSAEDAVYDAVREILVQVVRGDMEVIPLGGVSFALRKQFKSRIYQAGIEKAVQRITELRAQAPPVSPPRGQPPSVDTAVPDSGGSGG